jgi:ribosomal protein L23
LPQKYQVTPYDIYQLNPDAQSGLKPNTVLLIAKQSATKKEIAAAVQKTNAAHVRTLYLQRNNVRN